MGDDPEIYVEPKDAGERYTEYVRLDALVSARRNPKLHELKTIKKSIKRFGYVEQATVDERTGRLVAGHGRTQGLRDLEDAWDSAEPPPKGIKLDDDGAWMVPLSRGWASEDDTEADGYVVTSNRSNELGGWDETMLDEILADASETLKGLEGIGFEPPTDEPPAPAVEDLTPLRVAHVLVSYPVDQHGEVAEYVAKLEGLPGVQVRSTVNDSSK